MVKRGLTTYKYISNNGAEHVGKWTQTGKHASGNKTAQTGANAENMMWLSAQKIRGKLRFKSGKSTANQTKNMYMQRGRRAKTDALQIVFWFWRFVIRFCLAIII